MSLLFLFRLTTEDHTYELIINFKVIRKIIIYTNFSDYLHIQFGIINKSRLIYLLFLLMFEIFWSSIEKAKIFW